MKIKISTIDNRNHIAEVPGKTIEETATYLANTSFLKTSKDYIVFTSSISSFKEIK